MKNRFSNILLLWLLLSLLIANCARIQAPPGGPKDERAPKLVSCVPAKDSVNIALNSPVRLLFDERILLEEEYISLLPRPDGTSITIKPKEIIIEHNEEFQPNTTYRIAVSSKLTDLRKNSLKRGLNIAFSTGPRLDSLSIMGKVYNSDFSEASGIRIEIYDIEDKSWSDSLDPIAASWSGDNGEFQVTNLPSDSYFILAFKDNNNNGKLDSGEEIAIPSSMIKAGGRKRTSVVLFKPDTTAPELIMATSDNSNLIRFKFDEEIVLNPGSSINSLQSIFDFRLFKYRDEPQNIGIISSEGFTPGVVELVINGISDLAGNIMESEKITVSIPEPETDTIFPTAKIWSEALLPDDELTVYFDKIIFGGQIDVFDSSEKVIDGKTDYFPPNILTFSPEKDWNNYVKPRWRIGNCLSVVDKIWDDTTSHSINTEPSSMLGVLNVIPPYPCENPIVYAKKLSSKTEKILLKKSEANYSSTSIPSGEYRVWLFCDENVDSIWFPGNLHPLKFSEEIIIYPDTALVRGYWTTDIPIWKD